MPQYPYDYWNPPANSDYSTVVSASYITERDNEVKAIQETLGEKIVPSPVGGAPTVRLVDRLKISEVEPDHNLLLTDDGGKVCVRDEDTRPGVVKGDLDVFVNDNWVDSSIRVANIGRGVTIHAAYGGKPTVASVGTNEPLQFWAGNSNNGDYLFASTGNVGIGTTPPTAKLDVDSHTIRLRQFASPPISGDGEVGDIRLVDASGTYYIYVKVPTGEWKKAQLT